MAMRRSKTRLGIAVVYSLADKAGACNWIGMVYAALQPLGFTMAEADEAIRLAKIKVAL